MIKLRQKTNANLRKSKGELKHKIIAECGNEVRLLLNEFHIAVANKLNFVYYNLNIRILNMVIQLGLEMQQTFRENENE